MDRLEQIEQILAELALDRQRECKEREKEREEREKEREKREKEREKREKEREKERKDWEARQQAWEADRLKAKAEREASQRAWEQRWAKLEEGLKKTERVVGNMGDNNGDFAEELFYRSFRENPVLGGVTYDVVQRKIVDDLSGTEYDIMLFNGKSVAIIEVKYKAHEKDLERIIEKKTKAFRNSYRDYADHELYLGLASTVTYQALVERAREAGIYLLTQQGNHVEVVNDKVKRF